MNRDYEVARLRSVEERWASWLEVTIGGIDRRRLTDADIEYVVGKIISYVGLAYYVEDGLTAWRRRLRDTILRGFEGYLPRAEQRAYCRSLVNAERQARPIPARVEVSG